MYPRGRKTLKKRFNRSLYNLSAKMISSGATIFSSSKMRREDIMKITWSNSQQIRREAFIHTDIWIHGIHNKVKV